MEKTIGERRTERAEASARSFPFWCRRGGRGPRGDGGVGRGGANSRDINSVLALGGLHGGENYVPTGVAGALQHLSSLSTLVSLASLSLSLCFSSSLLIFLPVPLPLFPFLSAHPSFSIYPAAFHHSPPTQRRISLESATPARFRRNSHPLSFQLPCPAYPLAVGGRTVEEPAGGVTNQRLAIVNSTCAVKQLINKRLFTSRGPRAGRARSTLTRLPDFRYCERNNECVAR